MSSEELKSTIFIGIVEDNMDPKRLGRCRVRIANIFDEIPTEDIPWASPWKDLNGNGLLVPEIGKVVSVVFDGGNQYKPEYIHAEHFNTNLQKKLESLTDGDYKTMRALLFDHKTQIYSNDSEGLKIDYKLNNINITESDININLKDNFGSVNIGSANSNQQAILGNNYMEWFDEFVDVLAGLFGGAFLDSTGSPVVANVKLIEVLNKFKLLKDPKFLSKHVNIVDNEYVEKLDRINEPILGDAWKSTKQTNNLVVREPMNYGSRDGISTDTPPGQLSSYVDENGNTVGDTQNGTPPDIQPSNNPDVDRIIQAMIRKGYKVLTRPYELNIVGVRRQYEGQRYSNQFKDDLYVIFKVDATEKWTIYKFKISTMPGFYLGENNGNDFKKNRNGSLNVKQSNKMRNRKGVGIMMEAQYLRAYKLGTYLGQPALKNVGPLKFYRDNSDGDVIKYTSDNGRGVTGMHLHLGFPGGGSVDNWSEGCQVFAKKSELAKFEQLCREHVSKYGNVFNYTLMLERDI